MLDLLELQKMFILNHLNEGDIAVDFTMGNGHDTGFLSKTVGESGHVYAFDIQPTAIISTKNHLEISNCPNNYTLINDSHHKVLDYIKSPIKAGMFNLGYLPGSDKTITTLQSTTKAAVINAISLLGSDAVLLVAVYPGHKEGELEGAMLHDYFSTLDRKKLCVTQIKIVNSPTSPFFFVIETK